MYRITNPLTEGVFELALEVIKSFEGLHLESYPDPLSGGAPYTIGYGTTVYEDEVRVQLGHAISEEYAEALLVDFVLGGYHKLSKTVPGFHRMSKDQQVALLSFGYNLGYDFMIAEEGFETLKGLLKEKVSDHRGIAKAFSLYRNPGSNVELGLYRRRYVEACLFMSYKGINIDLIKQLNFEELEKGFANI